MSVDETGYCNAGCQPVHPTAAMQRRAAEWRAMEAAGIVKRVPADDDDGFDPDYGF